MTAAPVAEVMTHQPDRETTAIARLNERGKDLADLTDAEFQRGLERLKTVQTRMQLLLATALVEGAHFGNPKDDKGREAFKKPILFQAGAQELRRLMRLNLSRTRDDQIVSTEEYCEAVITLGIYDGTGRFIVERKGACNSREKRFKKFGGGGWIYDDAREVLHVVIAMAEKRAASLCTLEASGATAFLANGEEMEEGLADDKPITPWTDEEKKSVYERAGKKSIGRKQFSTLVMETLGRAEVGTGEDVARLFAAIDAYQAEAPKAEPAPQREPGED